MSVLVQISDTHFGTERPEVVQALLKFMADTAPQLVVLSGDVTQRARRSQFDACRRFLERLNAAALVAVPGNHDIPLFNIFARTFAPYAGYRRVFGDDLEPSFESDDFLVLCVNTTRAHRHKDGEVSAAQIDRVAERLLAASDAQLRIVVTHQPVQAVRVQDRKNVLHGHEAAVATWAQAGVDIIMGGHIHLPYVRCLTELRDLPRRVWTVQAGTALSNRIRDGVENSINVVHQSAQQRVACVERWDFAPQSQRFERVIQEELHLQRNSQLQPSEEASR